LSVLRTVVDSGRVYINVLDPRAEDPGTSVLAFDAHNGKRLWTSDAASVTAAGSGMVVVARQAGAREDLVALDGATGTARWRRTDVDFSWRDGNPIVTGPRLPVGLHGQQPQVVMVNIATGKNLWRAPPGLIPSAVSTNGVVLSDTTRAAPPVLVFSTNGRRRGTVTRLPPEPDQVTVPPEIDPHGRVYLGRGCPGRS
jgi:outer membrane protein assembly factor BamB